ncbi:alanyl-tRNA synthetase [Peptoclostridium litorale DSM 5388]|uniref:Alanine--tRNA ligase n=1 Tax=Peptoclostridium litorale DSM 5388 TaxID=1121324 RepID=A0A069RBP3_PEPLI|nr:alanine--tRNA ligase [Peptoclostridium litorale]KDR94178.1 alanine--tRNA ligase AlaS [Peptoclostridium litorale DSM 5388]SIN81900.1 alanyl-tRNA synthetase [Peptoclostridium litorale DSM 5388]
MKKLGLNEIRKRFLDFFESKDHYVRQSYPLVPQGDDSLLLINAGMAPMKAYFMGKEEPPKKRMATCQKCIRTGDIENVGVTARHATFFEMLGNFSFGDYFKRESINWGWEFVTKHLEIPADKIWISVYEDDDEAFEIWNKEVGIPAERMVRLGKEDNFWEIGVGPCGPCSELYYDRGEAYGCGSPDCKPGCDCDRYLEFWNHVFTQFDKDEEGVYHPLPSPNIDTGMGLERMACIMQDVNTIFEVDTIRHILNGVLAISGAEYGKDAKNDTSIRIITDHVRAVTFMIADGVLPSNEGRGYVLRRLLRRAARHGKLLGVEGAFLVNLMEKVIEVSGDAYPELIEKRDYIKKILRIEEDRFQETIDQGMDMLKDHMENVKASGSDTISGEDAFKLYDTYGFPVDLTKEIAEEEGLNVDEEGFESEMEKQRERARSARGDMEGAGWKEDVFDSLDSSIKSEFMGYEKLQMESTVLVIVKENELVDSASEGEKVTIILDKTPFYAESGGQAGDKGELISGGFKARVTDTQKGLNARIHHEVVVESGQIKTGQRVDALVLEEMRMATGRNHTATHMLHTALKHVLGTHVEQSGSLVSHEKLRFDFTHFESISKEELLEVERIVNINILKAHKVDVIDASLEEAKKMGATALFGEKYGDRVRVVKMGDYSMELCGGTHLENTSQVGLFKILSESGVAAGVRRIEAVTGMAVYNMLNQKQALIEEVCSVLKAKEDNIVNRSGAVMSQMKDMEKEISSMKSKLLSSSIDDILNNKESVDGVGFIAYKFENTDMDSLRDSADKLRDKMGSAVIVLANIDGDKVNFVCAATKDLMAKGVHAGNIVKEVAKMTGGGGGGRPDMAQAGGKDPSKVDEALSKVADIIKSQLK